MCRTRQVNQAALTATGRAGCAAGNAVDQHKGASNANDNTPGQRSIWICRMHLCHWLRGMRDAVNGSEADNSPETSAPVSQPRASSVSTRPGCTATAMSHCVLSRPLKRLCHSFAASRVASFEFAYPLKPAGRRQWCEALFRIYGIQGFVPCTVRYCNKLEGYLSIPSPAADC